MRQHVLFIHEPPGFSGPRCIELLPGGGLFGLTRVSWRVQVEPSIGSTVGLIAVHLDVWERLVTPQEDLSLVLAGIGTESCVLMKREWCVRTRTGNMARQSVNPDFISGHSYCLLAVINRPAANAVISAANLQYSRHLRLSLTSMESRMALLERLLLTPALAASPNQLDRKFEAPGGNITLFGSAFNPRPCPGSSARARCRGHRWHTDFLADSRHSAQCGCSERSDYGPDCWTNASLARTISTFLHRRQRLTRRQINLIRNWDLLGASVTLFGTNFKVAPVSVRFGATPATRVGSPTANQIVAAVPNMALGAVTITVVTRGGQTTTIDTFIVT